MLCHGWPELAYSWRHQIEPLAAAGYHVIAPNQRGYGASDRPEAVEGGHAQGSGEVAVRAAAGHLGGDLEAEFAARPETLTPWFQLEWEALQRDHRETLAKYCALS